MSRNRTSRRLGRGPHTPWRCYARLPGAPSGTAWWSRLDDVKISETLRSQRTLSFEFYPPREAEAVESVFRAIERLRSFGPSFVSVTYGAGGTTRTLTEQMSLRIKRQTDLELMAHITCVGQTRQEVHAVLARLERAGVENVIGLRGDPPRGQKTFEPVEGGFQHATDLIEHIKGHFPFGVAAACYPEGHPESPSVQSDLDYTRRKVDAGADFLVTQLFYDNDDFYRFVDRARQAGIQVPIVAGILPILSTPQIRRFTALCGSRIPAALDRQLDAFADDDAVRELGIEHATSQVRGLWDEGVDGVHFYVLNRSHSVTRILKNLGLSGHEGDSGKGP